MKNALCRAFCDSLSVQEVPAGLAVATTFKGVNGEALLFYIVGPDANGFWRLQDDGTTMPFIEASGAELNIGPRSEIFRGLLDEYRTSYDEQSGELWVGGLSEQTVPSSALRFIALLLRVQELLQTTREKAEAIWVEEAKNSLQKAVAGRAQIQYDSPIAADLSEWPADVVLRATDRPPVALFFGTSQTKAYEALLLNSAARYQFRQQVVVVLLLESDKGLTHKLRQRVDNNIVAPRYRGAEWDAIGRIAEEALGARPPVH